MTKLNLFCNFMKGNVIFKSRTIISERFVCVDYNLVKTEAGMQKIDISRKESLANYNIALCNLYF